MPLLYRATSYGHLPASSITSIYPLSKMISITATKKMREHTTHTDKDKITVTHHESMYNRFPRQIVRLQWVNDGSRSSISSLGACATATTQGKRGAVDVCHTMFWHDESVLAGHSQLVLKVWLRRPGCAATMIQYEDHLSLKVHTLSLIRYLSVQF